MYASRGSFNCRSVSSFSVVLAMSSLFLLCPRSFVALILSFLFFSSFFFLSFFPIVFPPFFLCSLSCFLPFFLPFISTLAFPVLSVCSQVSLACSSLSLFFFFLCLFLLLLFACFSLVSEVFYLRIVFANTASVFELCIFGTEGSV